MEIKNHKFDQRVAKFESTDKHSGNFSNKQLPDTIVIHYTYASYQLHLFRGHLIA